jgi:hypothetical protein
MSLRPRTGSHNDSGSAQAASQRSGLAVTVLRHVVGLFQGVPGARAFRRHIATAAARPGAGGEVLREALATMKSRERMKEEEPRTGAAA